jgi:hypothetical protein
MVELQGHTRVRERLAAKACTLSPRRARARRLWHFRSNLVHLRRKSSSQAGGRNITLPSCGDREEPSTDANRIKTRPYGMLPSSITRQ